MIDRRYASIIRAEHDQLKAECLYYETSCEDETNLELIRAIDEDKETRPRVRSRSSVAEPSPGLRSTLPSPPPQSSSLTTLHAHLDMSTFSQALGLGSTPSGPVPCYAAGSIIFSFVFSYGVLSSRAPKIIYGIDHNVSPREDVSKYGEAAIKSGKITRKQLDQLKRIEAAHANSVEHFPFFVGAVLFALHAHLPSVFINRICASYILSRVGYALSYALIDRHPQAYLRSTFWWASNLTCMYAFYEGGKAINGA